MVSIITTCLADLFSRRPHLSRAYQSSLYDEGAVSATGLAALEAQTKLFLSSRLGDLW